VNKAQPILRNFTIHILNKLCEESRKCPDLETNVFKQECYESAVAILEQVSKPILPTQDRNGAAADPRGQQRELRDEWIDLLGDLFGGFPRRPLPPRPDEKQLIAARKVAYALIDQLVIERYLHQDKEEGKDFHLPIMLLSCAIKEHVTMTGFVAKTMRSVLSSWSAHKRKCANDSMLTKAEDERRGASLLPSVLQALCSEECAVRYLALETTHTLLLPLDSEAAYHLADQFVHDKASPVSSLAQKIVQGCNVQDFVWQEDEEAIFEFIEMKDSNIIGSVLEDRTKRLADGANIPPSAAKMVLYDFSFNLKETMEAINEEREKVLARCGVLSHCSVRNDKDEIMESSQLCSICYEEVGPEETFRTTCSHVYCLECWKYYLENESSTGRKYTLLNVACPAEECNERLLEEEVATLAPPSLVSKREQALLHAFVEKDIHHAFCPGRDCDVVVRSDSSTGTVECESCNEIFCFGCSKSPHSPSTCNELQLWSKLFRDSKFWIRKNTKECPNCDAPIEKNSGCAHMTCAKCEYEFCWVCLSRYENYEMHECNAYDSNNNKDDGDDLKKKVFFSNRYDVHDEAEYFANKGLKEMDVKIDTLVRRITIMNDDAAYVLFRTWEILIDCRRFLKYSYVAAYAMQDEDKLWIFQTYQGVLESFVERLCYLAEMDVMSVYRDGGNNSVSNHLRSLSFFTTYVEKYTRRIVRFTTSTRTTTTT